MDLAQVDYIFPTFSNIQLSQTNTQTYYTRKHITLLQTYYTVANILHCCKHITLLQTYYTYCDIQL